MALTKNHTLPDASAIRPLPGASDPVRRSDRRGEKPWGSTMISTGKFGSKHDLKMI
jgi:hypothetical protein